MSSEQHAPSAGEYIQHHLQHFQKDFSFQDVKQTNIVAALKEAATGQSRKRSTIEVETQTDEGKGVLRYHVRPVRRDDSAAAMLL